MSPSVVILRMKRAEPSANKRFAPTGVFAGEVIQPAVRIRLSFFACQPLYSHVHYNAGKTMTSSFPEGLPCRASMLRPPPRRNHHDCSTSFVSVLQLVSVVRNRASAIGRKRRSLQKEKQLGSSHFRSWRSGLVFLR